MESLLSRAADFGCSEADGVPDVACACSSRTFKAEAKRAVSKDCSAPGDIAVAREWAIGRCSAGMSFSILSCSPHMSRVELK